MIWSEFLRVVLELRAGLSLDNLLRVRLPFVFVVIPGRSVPTLISVLLIPFPIVTTTRALILLRSIILAAVTAMIAIVGIVSALRVALISPMSFFRVTLLSPAIILLPLLIFIIAFSIVVILFTLWTPGLLFHLVAALDGVLLALVLLHSIIIFIIVFSFVVFILLNGEVLQHGKSLLVFLLLKDVIDLTHVLLPTGRPDDHLLGLWLVQFLLRHHWLTRFTLLEEFAR